MLWPLLLLKIHFGLKHHYNHRVHIYPNKNTKDDINAINKLLQKLNPKRLESFLYDELYEESDFVFFALD